MSKFYSNLDLIRRLMIMAIPLVLSACASTGQPPSAFAIDTLPTQSTMRTRLAQASMPDRMRRLIVRLYSRDAQVRANAAASLANYAQNASVAVPYLIQLLADDTPVQLPTDSTERHSSRLETTPGQQASRALAAVGDSASNALILSLNDSNPQVRSLSVKALGQIGDIKNISFLIAALNDPDRSVQAAAAFALGEYRHPMAVQKIIDAYPTVNAEVRTTLIYALAQINDLLAVPFLIKQAKSQDPQVRAAVMLALGKLGDARAVPALLHGITDSDPDTRINAAYSLGRYYSISVVSALIGALGDSNQQVKLAAQESLNRLSGVDFGLQRNKWLQWWEDQRAQMR